MKSKGGEENSSSPPFEKPPFLLMTTKHMKTMYRQLKKIIRASMILLLTGACIGEDFSDCPPLPTLYIYFSNALAEDARPIRLPDVATRADVFIFDQDSLFVQCVTDSVGYSFHPQYRMRTLLPKGKYHFITWLNMKECYQTEPLREEFVKGQTHMGQALLHFSKQTQSVETPPELLFHGAVNDTTVTGKRQDITIPVMPMNYQVNFTVTGPLNPYSIYRFSIVDDNATYKFDCAHLLQGRQMDYNNICRMDGQNRLCSSHTLMKIAKERETRFEIVNLRNGNQVYYTPDIVGLITQTIEKAGAQADFNKEYVFNIDIELKGVKEEARMEARITVNGWYVPDEEGKDL